jgi:hypothetical protein
LSESSDRSDGERHTKHLNIVMVDLIPKTGFADLVQALELVQVQGITIGIIRRWKKTARRSWPSM